MQLPPPVHGVTMCNEIISRSELISSKFKVKILPFRYGKSISEMQKNGVKKIVLMIYYLLKFTVSLISFRPSVVYFTISPTGNAFFRDVFFVLLMKIFRRKIVYHLHGKGISEKTGLFYEKIYKFIFHNTTIICLSEELASDIVKVKSNADIKICPNGIEENCSLHSYRKDNNTFQVVFLSNLSAPKGIDIFLNLVSNLTKKESSINFHLAGPFSNAYTKKDLDAFIRKNPSVVGKFTYHGGIYGKEKWELLNSTDLLLYPSRNDAFPLVIIEAISSGNVVFASNEGAIPEILNGISGSEVISDWKSAEIKILDLVNNKELGKFKESSIEKYKMNYTKEKFEERLCEILSAI